ncbi:hypothetical protein EON66_05655, partial [archaeon]
SAGAESQAAAGDAGMAGAGSGGEVSTTAVLGSLSELSPGNKMYVVVEKNFKVYAYSNKEYQIALLALFAKIEMRLPNLIVATLTRRSMMEAFDRGISAKLIHHFLVARAHPYIARQGIPVPANVIDQLYLWESERHRATFRNVCLLRNFSDESQFAACYSFLESNGHAIFSCNTSRFLLVIDKAAQPPARKFLATWRPE